MSREILFRAKRIGGGPWVEGDLTHCLLIGATHICRIEDNLSTTTHRVDPETVCQYTGLTDKSGERIFEGDIVYIIPEEENFLVVWDPDAASFQLSGDEWAADFNNFGGSEMEIIDNVFDNPDLVTRNRE